MKCNQVNRYLPDLLLDQLDNKTKSEIESHLSICQKCKMEVENLNTMWTKLGSIPEQEPNTDSRFKFETMLEAYKQGMQQSKVTRSWREIINGWLEKWLPRQPIVQFATAILLFAVGIMIGSRFGPVKKNNGELTQLQQEVQNLRRSVTISLLKQQSPSERLQGVSLTSQLKQPNSEILTALLNTLNYDPNVNVRLATVDALYLFSERPMIRQGLIESLARQESPLVQIAIIDLLVDIREKRSIQALKKLIQDNHLNVEVKERAEWGIGQL
jgi:Tfp pilus assembly protein PilN